MEETGLTGTDGLSSETVQLTLQPDSHLLPQQAALRILVLVRKLMLIDLLANKLKVSWFSF